MTSVDAKTWFETILNNDIDALEELLERCLLLIRLQNKENVGYDESVRTQANAVLGSNTRNMNAIAFAINAFCQPETIHFLIEEGSSAVVNARWGNDNTALHLAAFLGDVDSIQGLLAKGADVTLKNKNNLTAFDVASTEEAQRALKGEALLDEKEEFVPLKREDSTVNLAEVKRSGPPNSPSLAEQMTEMLFTSDIFGRPSFGAADILKLAQEIEQDPTKTYKHKKNADNDHGHMQVDPLRDVSQFSSPPQVVYTISDSMQNRSPLPKALSPVASNVRSKTFRDSIDKLAASLKYEIASSGSMPRQGWDKKKLFVRIVHIREFSIPHLKSSSQLYMKVTCGAQQRCTLTFKEEKQVLISDEFLFTIDDEKSFKLNVEIKRKRSQKEGIWSSPLKLLSPKKHHESENLDAKDEIIAYLTPINYNTIAKLSENKLGKTSYVLCPPTSEPVLGIVDLQFYLHTDKMASFSPQNFDECLQLQRMRTFEKVEKIWWKGDINYSTDLQWWKQRSAELRDGKMFTFELEKHAPREVIDFKGFKDIVVMNNEECDIRNSFKITTSSGYCYFYLTSHKDMTTVIDSILNMMASVQGDMNNKPSTSSSLSSSSSVRSSASSLATAAQLENIPPTLAL